MEKKKAIIALIVLAIILWNLNTDSVHASEKIGEEADNEWYEMGDSDFRIDYAFFDTLGLHHTSANMPDLSLRSLGEWEQQSNGKWKYRFSDGSYASNEWLLISNYWYFFDSDEYMYTGWLEDNGKIYYLQENSPGQGRMAIGWKQIYLSSASSAEWFYFKQNGVMATGWQHISNNVSSSWYYLGSNGIMRTGWQRLSYQGVYHWYYFGDDGKMRTGWQFISYNNTSSWYYFGTDGIMRTGWLTHGGYRYYLKTDGIMVTGWNTIEGYSYYFNSQGRLQNTKRRAFILGNDSQLAYNDVEGWEDCLSYMSFRGVGFECVEKRLQITYSEFCDCFETFMTGVEESDITYLFITCHGMQPGLFSMFSDSYMTGQLLRNLLDQYEGKFVIMLDSCYSGAIIDRSGYLDQREAYDSMESDFLTAFCNQTRSGDFEDSKYLVMCSSKKIEVSNGFTNGNQTYSLANIYWMLGCGWDVLNNTNSTWYADSNHDSIVSLHELYAFSYVNVINAVNEYNANHPNQSEQITEQNIVVYPSNSDFSVFADSEY